jgi:hypothetical protein
MWALPLGVLIVFLASAPARADRVHLVGGSVLEGKASRHGDQVVVEVAAGELRLSASEVVRIEPGESSVQEFERRFRQLAPTDGSGLLLLADFCREHGMRDRERQVLQRLLALDPDHEQARTRLGYTRVGQTWMAGDASSPKPDAPLAARDACPRSGAPPEGRPPSEACASAAPDQLEHERTLARLEREAARAHERRMRERAPEQEPGATPSTAATSTSTSTSTSTLAETTGAAYPPPYFWVPRSHHGRARWPSERLSRSRRDYCVSPECGDSMSPVDAQRTRPFPIPGVKDPFDYLR